MEIGSSPVNGSSYMIIIGSSTMARASATRRAMPPDSSQGIRSRAPRRPTVWSFINTTFLSTASGSRVCSRIGKATFSNTDKSVSSAPCWNSMPMRLRSWYSSRMFRSGTFCPSTSTWPWLGRRRPPIRLSSAALPQPLPPMMAVTLPRGIPSVRLSRMVRVLYLKLTPRIFTRLSLSFVDAAFCDTLAGFLYLVGSWAGGMRPHSSRAVQGLSACLPSAGQHAELGHLASTITIPADWAVAGPTLLNPDKEFAMPSACIRFAPALLLSAVLALLPGAAAAGGALFIKGGALRLQDDGQMIDLQQRNLDDTSHSTLAFGW